MATDHDQHHHSHGDDGAAPLNHETTDISLEGLGKLTIGLVLFLFVVTGVMYVTYRTLDNRARAADTSISRINADRRAVDIAGAPLMDQGNTLDRKGRQPAGPALLTNEPAWLAENRAKFIAAQTTYAWVSKETGAVRLPIERAKLLIIERGVPVTTPPAEAAPPADAAAPPTAVAPTAVAPPPG